MKLLQYKKKKKQLLPDLVWRNIVSYLLGYKIDRFYLARKPILLRLTHQMGFHIKGYEPFKLATHRSLALRWCTRCHEPMFWETRSFTGRITYIGKLYSTRVDCFYMIDHVCFAASDERLGVET